MVSTSSHCLYAMTRLHSARCHAATASVGCLPHVHSTVRKCSPVVAS
jgi:hypothetical protein